MYYDINVYVCIAFFKRIISGVLPNKQHFSQTKTFADEIFRRRKCLQTKKSYIFPVKVSHSYSVSTPHSTELTSFLENM